MPDYDSESSGADDVETSVTVGYASKEPTGDDFSQLGGHPTWLNDCDAPSRALAKCKVCNGLLNLLLQLNAELPDKFPYHERSVYLFGCRKKQCRRKEGSIRGIRSTRVTKTTEAAKAQLEPVKGVPLAKPRADVGASLFGAPSSTIAQNANPFASSGLQAANPFSSSASQANSFASASTVAAKPAQKPTTDPAADLPATFAQKASLNAPPPPRPTAPEPWPSKSDFPSPYPAYYIDADKEYLDSDPQPIPQNVRVTELGEDSSATTTGNNADEKSAFESAMDTAFQKFADRLSQNPEQVLRYEHGGQPFLYSKKDAVGKAWPKVPRCGGCGAGRVFELQLTPHAITELEAEEMGLDGMDWGTIILAVCGSDCEGQREEWVGVQWEELTNKR